MDIICIKLELGNWFKLPAPWYIENYYDGEFIKFTDLHGDDEYRFPKFSTVIVDGEFVDSLGKMIDAVIKYIAKNDDSYYWFVYYYSFDNFCVLRSKNISLMPINNAREEK